MKCYNCNSKLSDDRNICPRCGVDIRLYRKVIYASNQYYNLGLARAKARDLTGAAECLRTSLQLNKKNINARNLLGLVYYEMGEAALALKEWIISKNFRHRGNDADDYIENLRSNRRALDSADHSIHKYNQALEYAKSGSKDLAKIQLKKVIAVNPRMLKAYQLLALLYMEEQKYESAKKVIAQCMEIDRGNPITISYQKELAKYKKPEVKANIGVAGELEREEVIIPVRMRDYGSYLSSAMYILIGFLLSLGILYYVIMPGREAEYQADNDVKIQEYEDRYVSLNSQIAELNEQLNNLQDDRNDLAEEYQNSSEAASDLHRAYVNLLSIAKLYIDGDFMTLVDAFPTLDGTASDDETYQLIYESMRQDYENNMTTRLFQMAGTYRETLNDRPQAINIYAKVLELDPTYDDALYYQAVCYQEIGDSSNASALYVTYLQQFPSGSWVADIRNRLFQMAPDVLQRFDTGGFNIPTPEQPQVQESQEVQQQPQSEDTQPSSEPEDNPEQGADTGLENGDTSVQQP